VAGPKPHSNRLRDDPLAVVECSGPNTGWAEIVGPGAASNQDPHIGYYLSDAGSRAIFAEQYFVSRSAGTHRSSPGAEYASFSAIDPADAAFVDSCSPCGSGTAPMAIAENSGHTLLRPGRVDRVNFVTAAAFVSTSQGWAVGEVEHYNKGTVTPKIVHTVDGGRNWATQYVA
jgi:hypothetical protein